jgi:hypothetical protein
MDSRAANPLTFSSSVRLFTPEQVAMATFFGAPLAGSVVMALNYRRVGLAQKALPAVFLGLVSTAALVVLSVLLPDGARPFLAGLPIGSVMAMLAVARSVQGPLVTFHVGTGGGRGSGWSAAGIGIASAILLFAGAAAILVLRDPGLGARIAIGPHQDVYYRGGISEGQARRVADVLKDAGYFPPGQVADVQVYSDGQNPHVLFVVRRDAWQKGEAGVMDFFRGSGEEVSRRVFGGGKVVVDLADERLAVYASLVVPSVAPAH